MNKNFIFSMVAIVLAIATITVGVLLIVKNTGDSVVTIENKTALVGDTVSIPVVIEKNPGIWGGQILIDYDSENLSFVSVSNGDVFDGCEVNDTGDCVALLVTQTQLKDSKENGTIAVLNFKIKVSADKGKQNLSFNDETNFCNSDEEMVNPVLNDGVITVK